MIEEIHSPSGLWQARIYHSEPDGYSYSIFVKYPGGCRPLMQDLRSYKTRRTVTRKAKSFLEAFENDYREYLENQKKKRKRNSGKAKDIESSKKTAKKQAGKS